jgi:hypothetical protein
MRCERQEHATTRQGVTDGSTQRFFSCPSHIEVVNRPSDTGEARAGPDHRLQQPPRLSMQVSETLSDPLGNERETRAWQRPVLGRLWAAARGRGVSAQRRPVRPARRRLNFAAKATDRGARGNFCRRRPPRGPSLVVA